MRCIQSLVQRMQAKACFAGHLDASTFIYNFFSGYAVIFAHKGKTNTLFGTVKGLLLFVCTHNINKMLCFYKIENKHDVLSAVSDVNRSASQNEPKLSEYMPHRHDKNIYRKL